MTTGPIGGADVPTLTAPRDRRRVVPSRLNSVGNWEDSEAYGGGPARATGKERGGK